MSNPTTAKVAEAAMLSLSNAQLAEAEIHMRTPPPSISDGDAEAFARLHYGRDVKARALSGERDKNFLVTEASGWSAILKFYNSAEDPATRDFQHGALLHVHARDPGCCVPKVHRARDGSLEVSASLGDLNVVGVMIERMPGENPVEGDLLPPLRRSVGEGIGRLMMALSDYEHARAARVLLWDLMLLGEFKPLLDFVEDNSLRHRLADWLERHVEIIRPAAARLPHQVIHNDMSLSNILVDPKHRDRLSGIIDFGDCIYAPRVNEVAIAASYFIGPHDDVAQGIAEMLGGIRRYTSISLEEIQLLPQLLQSRLAMRILLAGWRARLFPENSRYLLRSTAAAIGLWNRCAALSPQHLSDRITILLNEEVR